MFNEWQHIEDDLLANGYDPKVIKEELLKGHEATLNLTHLKQKQVAGEVNQETHTFIDGIGECVAKIDVDAYFYWGMREKGCWEDKTFMKEFLRDNEACRVKSQARKTSIMIP